MTPRILDLRAEAPAKRARSRVAGGRTVLRDPRDVDGITLHQTAVVFGARASHKKRAAAEGAPELAPAYRVAEDVPAHAVALDGVVVLGAPLRQYLYHANALNRSTLGLEIEGRYPGLVDDPNTVADEAKRTMWGDVSKQTELTGARVAAAAEALRLLVSLGQAEGMRIRYVYAHRQASGSRRSDPGAALWRALRPVWLSLGLVERPTWTRDDGRPLPAGWGPYEGRY
tara:strand:+ start:3703 stop:4386 length:684 start_codon:yes stop_codon:yes gene_type:complete